jgi:hypothetical protein
MVRFSFYLVCCGVGLEEEVLEDVTDGFRSAGKK